MVELLMLMDIRVYTHVLFCAFRGDQLSVLFVVTPVLSPTQYITLLSDAKYACRIKRIHTADIISVLRRVHALCDIYASMRPQQRYAAASPFEITERVIAIEIQEAELATNLSTWTQPAAPQQTKH